MSTFRQDRIATLLIGGRKVLEPPVPRSTTWSRLVVGDDGLPEPLIDLMARELFPEWDPKKQTPYWKDHDPTNESAANVALKDVVFQRRKSRRSSYGEKAGTPAYWKKYRQENAATLKEYYKTRRARQREEAKLYQEAVQRGELPARDRELDDLIRAIQERKDK